MSEFCKDCLEKQKRIEELETAFNESQNWNYELNDQLAHEISKNTYLNKELRISRDTDWLIERDKLLADTCKERDQLRDAVREFVHAPKMAMFGTGRESYDKLVKLVGGNNAPM